MGILGGSRIDGITIFLCVTLILYTILANGIMATFTADKFVDPYGGRTIDIELGEDYEYNDIKNVTGGMFPESQVFTALNPDRKIDWYLPLFGKPHFTVYCYGKNWWDSWTTQKLVPVRTYEDELLQIYNENRNFSKVIYNHGGELETHVFYCPLFYYNESAGEVTYLNDTLADSFDSNKITVIMATNQTFYNYDIGQIFGLLTGFSTHGMPYEVSVIIGGIFWVLLILLLVKLVVG